MTGKIDFRTPGAGFDQPVEMWLACHQRVQRFAALLSRLADHLSTQGADEDAQVTAVSIRRYFNEAAPRHHEDEEVDMFPRLRERLDSEHDKTVLDVLEQVEADHLEMGGLWKRLDEVLAEISRGKGAKLEQSLIDRFATMYRHHIDAEERVVLPALRRVLGDNDWAAVGRAMAERRGLDWAEIAGPAGVPQKRGAG
ncbi:MAG: hemerythrin domain-containing protein [Burkholderiaceae bacterium]